MSALTQLQQLLRDLFQLDLADLDFGLYRLLHLKRSEAEDPFDEILINGDTATPGVKSLDALFKRLLMEGER